MPTYEYRCDSCSHEFEMFQGITEPPLRQCPRCRKRKVRRLLGPGGGLLFKGSGFYITDYRSSSYQSKAKSDSPGGASSPEKKSGGTPSKGPKADKK